jgi:hypothetical protein
MSRLIRTLVIVTMAATASLIAAPAHAADTTGLDRLRAEVTHRIDLRLGALTRFDAHLTGARYLTDTHVTTLRNLVATERSGLTELRTTVAGESTLAALRADAKSMVQDYRVYLLVGRQVRLTGAADAGQRAISRLSDAYDRLADKLAQAKEDGADTTAAEANLAEGTAALARARADLDGQVEKLLAIKPGPDAAAITAAVNSVRTALGTCRTDLRTAIAEARHVRTFLKGL